MGCSGKGQPPPSHCSISVCQRLSSFHGWGQSISVSNFLRKTIMGKMAYSHAGKKLTVGSRRDRKPCSRWHSVDSVRGSSGWMCPDTRVTSQESTGLALIKSVTSQAASGGDKERLSSSYPGDQGIREQAHKVRTRGHQPRPPTCRLSSFYWIL